VTPKRARGAFATTRWTTVNAARQTSQSQAANALAELCESYWPPLYAFLRRQGYRPEEAQDLTQGFFARLLETALIRTADPERGRFRSFLLTALKRYVINEHERSATARRGGGHAHLSLDFDEAERAYTLEPRTDETPDRLFDRRWAAIALDRALQRLRAEYTELGRAPVADALLPYLTDTGELPPYRTVAAQLDLSEGAVKVAVHRMRQRYGAILRSEIAETVLVEGEVEAELRELLRAVST
jgi:RNA polymerase sigma-70 factor (ECF subfamily)